MKYLVSDHYDGKHFHNKGLKIKKNFRQLFKMLYQRLSKEKKLWPKHIKNQAIPQLAQNISAHECVITYINHASHLIQLKNLNILLDPIFVKRAGPLNFVGPKRVRAPGIAFKNLPPIDCVLISHNHYDHMDLTTLKKLDVKFKPTFIVPLGNKKYLSRKKIQNVIELDWWQQIALDDKQIITLVPAQHWSQRSLTDVNQALWGGFYIYSSAIKIYFAGDTGFGEHFKEIKQQLGAPDISILPIGSYAPRWFMRAQHINPEEAVLAFKDLHSKIALATHHQTFRLSAEGIDDPVLDLQKSLNQHHIPPNKFLTPETGETFYYKKA